MENPKEKQFSDEISHMFSSIHKRYDFFNHFFSLGADFWWRHKLVHAITLGKTNKVLDMAAGTLDVSIAIAKKYPQAQILAADICEDMLAFGDEKVKALAQKARDKKECCLCKSLRSFFQNTFSSQNTPSDVCKLQTQNHNNLDTSLKDTLDIHKDTCKKNIPSGIDTQILTQVMDAQKIPLEDNCFDACTIAFGIRNVKNRLKALKEMHRVLETGGQLCILEFAPLHTPYIGKAYHFYLEKIMPKFVKLFVGEEESYTYLAKSIKEFPVQDDFVKIIQEAGFSFVKYEKLTLGLVTLYTAIKSDISLTTIDTTTQINETLIDATKLLEPAQKKQNLEESSITQNIVNRSLVIAETKKLEKSEAATPTSRTTTRKTTIRTETKKQTKPKTGAKKLTTKTD